MEPRRCKQCTYLIDPGCTHLDCLMAHAQGFCSRACEIAYFAIKDYEIERMRKSA